MKSAKGIADTDVHVGTDDPKEDEADVKEVVEDSLDCVAFIHDIFSVCLPFDILNLSHLGTFFNITPFRGLFY